jgi:hypothetical protein
VIAVRFSCAASAEITTIQNFTVESIGKDLFESKRAGLKFQFNEDKTAFEMIISDGQKNLQKINKKYYNYIYEKPAVEAGFFI